MPASLLDSQLATLEPLGPDERGITIAGTTSPRATAASIVRRLPGREDRPLSSR
jgi:gluconate kinase